MTNCTLYQNDLKAYTDGELSPLRRFLVRRHLPHCASCREEISVISQLTEDLQATEPNDALPPRLRERLLESPPAPILGSNTEQSNTEGNRPASPTSSRAPQNWGRGTSLRRLPAWTLAALVVVAWFVFYPAFTKVRENARRESAPTVTASEQRMKVYKPIPLKLSPQVTAGGSSASNSDGAVSLSAGALPPPPKPTITVRLSDREAGLDTSGKPYVHIMNGASPMTADSLNGNPDSLRQVHKEAGIGIQVPNPEATGDKLNNMMKETGGFVAANNLSTGNDGLKSGELIVKVPEAQFETFLAAVAKLGTVQSKNVTGQDITDKTSDATQEQAVREGDLEKSEARLKALGSKAKWEDQENTRDLRIQLAQTRARLKLLKRMVALGTITIDLSQTPKNAAPVTNGFLGTLQTTTHDALQSLVGSFAALLALVIWLLAYSPIWVPLLLVGCYALKEYKKREVAVQEPHPASFLVHPLLRKGEGLETRI